MLPAGARPSDRSTEGRRRAPWGWLSLAAGALGVGALGAVAALTATRGSGGSLPDWAGYALYGSVPSLGVLALACGMVGAPPGTRRWPAWIGATLGAVLVVAGLAAIAILLIALRRVE